MKQFDVQDIINAGCNLEPLICRACGSSEVTFHQYVGDAYCAWCGVWQLEIEKAIKDCPIDPNLPDNERDFDGDDFYGDFDDDDYNDDLWLDDMELNPD